MANLNISNNKKVALYMINIVLYSNIKKMGCHLEQEPKNVYFLIFLGYFEKGFRTIITALDFAFLHLFPVH